MKSISAIVFAVAGALGGVSANAAYQITSITMTDLGTLGGNQAMAHDINDAGHIVGMAHNSVSKPRAFFYANGVMTDLQPAGGFSREARGINNSDQVVGWWTDPTGPHAFLWQGGTFVPLEEGSLPPGPPFFLYSQSRAYAIADNGRIVGQRTYVDVDDIPKDAATMWTDVSSPFLLDPQGLADDFASYVADVDELGRAVGWNAFGPVDWLWNYFGPPPVGKHVAPPLPLANYTHVSTDPRGVHETGGIVGSMTFFNNADPDVTIRRAFRWNGSAFISSLLGVLPGGTRSEAEDVNSQRFTVGWSNFQVQPPLKLLSNAGFIHHTDFGMVALPRTGFSACYARALNERDHGGYIHVVGYCTGHQGNRAIRWNVRVSNN